MDPFATLIGTREVRPEEKSGTSYGTGVHVAFEPLPV